MHRGAVEGLRLSAALAVKTYPAGPSGPAVSMWQCGYGSTATRLGVAPAPGESAADVVFSCRDGFLKI